MVQNIILTNWQIHSADLINIRTEVFIQEQQVSAADEWDGLDEQALHFLALSAQGEAIGCARLLPEIAAHKSLYHIGRVAILKPFRNQGIGHQLMQYVIAYCKKAAPENTIYLHAQTERRQFYETLGFAAEGDEFIDAGILHISMHLTVQGA
ncbi:GNAT family N-acetyltransferase [Cellvibrio sp. OA-2007]|uniref:GNAT family N-acetyltransferase n=1 Tax=Cellvibrio sp. OA-2007 TaxID=529823 RepID=UPI000783B9A7|nr:GNAT family N-acetyltransferase [Cellvibrio sp. OA-2007]